MPIKKFIAQDPLNGKLILASAELEEVLKAPQGSVVLLWTRFPFGGYEYSFIGVV